MTFPAYALQPVAVTNEIIQALGATPKEAYLGRDLLCIFDRESIVRGLIPDMDAIKKLEGLLLHTTAPGDNVDCVSRSFAPKLNVAEDPVCGSGHCHIVPYWSQVLHKDEIVAYQASKRGGTLYCRMDDPNVKLCGKAVLYAICQLNLDL